MKKIYLMLAIIGALIPYVFFIQFFQVEGINLTLFVGSLFANDAAGGFSADLLLSSVVFWFYMIHQLKELGAPKPYFFILLNLTIGLSCALPAYLYAREASNEHTTL